MTGHPDQLHLNVNCTLDKPIDAGAPRGAAAAPFTSFLVRPFGGGYSESRPQRRRRAALTLRPLSLGGPMRYGTPTLTLSSGPIPDRYLYRGQGETPFGEALVQFERFARRCFRFMDIHFRVENADRKKLIVTAG